MKTLFYLLSTFLFTASFAQKQANIWYFGDHAGLDFRGDKPVELTDGQLSLDGASASISDEEGNLLFYTDGGTVWNRLHQVMPNGTGLSGLMPGWGSQTLIVPRPGKDSLYYIFTAVPDWYTDLNDTAKHGFRYSIVAMGRDNGKGDVIEKNTLLFKNTTFKMTAVFRPNKRDVWLVTHEANNNTFRVYLITEAGISSEPVFSSIGAVHAVNEFDDTEGQMKLSPDGGKLGVTLAGSAIVQLFDFDPVKGIIENSQTIPYSAQMPIIYGLEFSPNGKFLYFTDASLDCGNASLINPSILQVDTENPTQSPLVAAVAKRSENIAALQLAPDGKIYVANCESNPFTGGRSFLGVINFPGRRGTACNYNYEDVHLTTGKVNAQGLPNFIQSYFLFDDPVVLMPNVFTPNETDTINARFIPIRLENINYVSLTIINRWGQQVFYTENLETGWEGSDRPEGVYYWSMRYDGKNGRSGSLRGWVEVRR
jgi:hypothetical protein